MTPSPQAMCGPAKEKFADPLASSMWNGWGVNLVNTRYQDAATAGIAVAEVPHLKLKWAFGFPGDVSASAQPTIVGGRVFVGSQGGKVYSLSATTGCIHWWFEAPAVVRTAVSIGHIESEAGGNYAAFFGDSSAVVYAVEAATGKLLWKVKVDSHPAARITGSPVYERGRLYIPVSSSEEGSAAAPDYQCCRFRGSVVALDCATGKQICGLRLQCLSAPKTQGPKGNTTNPGFFSFSTACKKEARLLLGVYFRQLHLFKYDFGKGFAREEYSAPLCSSTRTDRSSFIFPIFALRAGARSGNHHLL